MVDSLILLRPNVPQALSPKAEVLTLLVRAHLQPRVASEAEAHLCLRDGKD